MGSRAALTATAVVLVLVLFALQAEAEHCPRGFLSCADGECIRQAKFCDGQQDCKDSSDEAECAMKCHPPDFFRCHNGRCVSHIFVCDGEDECGDGSDEVECEGGPQSSKAYRDCTQDEFRCTDGLCIPGHWKCDGEHNCVDGSDETLGCTTQNVCNEKGLFLCANHYCIPGEWRCDGHNDCNDNSDEQGCHKAASGGCPVDRGLYPCGDHSCVELVELCDGQTQCPDGSDEGPACNTSKAECQNFGCSHRCVPTPNGPICICPKGFILSKEKYCKDIDECEEYGICSQICNNVPGSYQCACAPHFQLESNNASCKAVGPEALMVYALKTEVRALFLSSLVMFPVASKQGHVAGVAYDGIHMYWTSLVNGEEAILRSKEDGSDREVVVSAGLSLPEDLAIDWLTGNIYFTDGEEKHIGVCSNDGKICTILVNEDVDAPRAIALHIAEGLMYWTDWGKTPMVARAGMDGSAPMQFVSQNLQWPNGLALDVANQRLYWVDAKLSLVESIKFDGTDRRTILKGVLKHPYALALFEDYLYWSDFKTSEILSCNKFTGKDQRKIAHSRDNYVYGLNIYHPSLHPEIESACDKAGCGDICLLAPNHTYTCACSSTKILNEDRHTCREVEKHEGLAIAGGHVVIRIDHLLLGKQEYTSTTLSSAYKIAALAYNSLTGEIFISDIGRREILIMNMKEEHLYTQDLVTSGIGTITGMDFDHLGNNLYWCDSEHQTLEVLNLPTMSRKVLLRTYDEHIPLDVAVIPDDGVMFVAFKNILADKYHIDKLHMDGSHGTTHVIETTLHGPRISLSYDHHLKRVFFADSGRRTIESTDIEGADYHRYAELSQEPLSITTLNREIFWTSNERTHLHWSNKYNSQSKIKQATLDVFNGEDLVVMTALRTVLSTPDHPCHTNNGGCTHLCLVSLNHMICTCPDNLQLDSDNHTCIKPTKCTKQQFRCSIENKCIPKALRCDGKPDCSANEDERDCPPICSPRQYACTNGQCIPLEQRCDEIEQCTDGSDEFSCSTELCKEDEFHCLSGECINIALRCDRVGDCRDDSDEDCADVTCPPGRFRCKSGGCIPATWECDRELNCADGSDEHENCPGIKCLPEDFTCTNKRCIDKSLKCNGKDDCGDNSDERDCGSPVQEKVMCGEDEFRCALEKKLCVPQAARCNGTAECPKGEDEMHCGCSIHQFECDHNRCIDERWVCDGMKDCDDQKDEDPRICDHIRNGTDEPCQDFKCRSGECISLDQVCNGVPQCADGTDEGGKCRTACTFGHPCDQVCNPTPGGPRCTCKPGYHMPQDSVSCLDNDECAKNICAQLCTNTPGSYSCSCVKGYALRLDRRSCKAEGEAMQVIFAASGNEIRMVPYSLQTVHVLHQDTGIRIVGLDINIPKKTIYWSSGTGGSIFYTSLENRSTRSVTKLGRPEELAVDWITGNIYFVDGTDSEEHWIKVCNFEKKKCAKLLLGTRQTEIDNLVVDPISGYLFWTETSFLMFDEPHTVIKRADMSGENPSQITKGLAIISGLAIDIIHRTLFYIDHKSSLVGSIGYHGDGEHVVFNKEVKHPSGLALFEDSLYWISSESGKLIKCRVFGQPRQCDWVQLNTYNVQHFTIFQQERQPTSENTCSKMDCSNICVRSSDGDKCVCADGTLESNDAPCGEHPPDLKPSFPDEHLERDTSSPSAGAITGIIIMLMIILGCCIYSFYFWRKSGKPIWDPRVLFRQTTYKREPLEPEDEDDDDEEMECIAAEQNHQGVPQNQTAPTDLRSSSIQKELPRLPPRNSNAGPRRLSDTLKLLP